MKDKLLLSDMLLALRHELQEAQTKAAGQNLKFSVEDIELEVKVATSAKAVGKGGVKFWVYNAEAGGKIGTETMHTIRLKMKPESADGSPLQVSGQTPEPE
ncbi:MAG: hypothetical protein GY862_08295 [Gammaproteobacteria bacterium]|nr:hypothetical protein [Gammaproteobacteria bacterium]